MPLSRSILTGHTSSFQVPLSTTSPQFLDISLRRSRTCPLGFGAHQQAAPFQTCTAAPARCPPQGCVVEQRKPLSVSDSPPIDSLPLPLTAPSHPQHRDPRRLHRVHEPPPRACFPQALNKLEVGKPPRSRYVSNYAPTCAQYPEDLIIVALPHRTSPPPSGGAPGGRGDGRRTSSAMSRDVEMSESDGKANGTPSGQTHGSPNTSLLPTTCCCNIE